MPQHRMNSKERKNCWFKRDRYLQFCLQSSTNEENHTIDKCPELLNEFFAACPAAWVNQSV